jgi:hypothetical protein
MGEGMGQRWLPLKKYWELGRDKQLVFCSDYVQRAYSFPKSTKEVFCEEGVWHSLNKLPTQKTNCLSLPNSQYFLSGSQRWPIPSPISTQFLYITEIVLILIIAEILLNSTNPVSHVTILIVTYASSKILKIKWFFFNFGIYYSIWFRYYPVSLFMLFLTMTVSCLLKF